MTIYTCANPATWHPTMHTRQRHHHPPLSWRREILADDPAADQTWWKVVAICGLDHDEYHGLLDAHVRFAAVPPASVTKTFGRYVRALVAEAWANKPPGKPPYTLETP